MRAWRAIIVAVLMGIAAMTPVHADTVYAYWSYWQGDTGVWKYATTGPATAPALDGAIDGWRFTLGSDGRAAHPAPAVDFEAVCGNTAKSTGMVRVAIIIDYGSAADLAPVAQCAVVESGLSRASALSAVASLRFNNGFICGINDIPMTGCGDAVTVPTTPTPSATPSLAETPRATATASDPPAPHMSTSAMSPTPTSGGTRWATAAPTTTASDPTPMPSDRNSEASVGTQGSPIATVVTVLLAGIVLALALRSARRNRGSR